MAIVEAYCTPAGNSPIEEYIIKLTKKHKTKEIAAINLYIKRLEECGYFVNEKYPETIKHLRDGIYELRPDDTRIFFFFFEKDRIVLLHAYEKKRWTVPTEEIDKAIQEKKGYLRRNKNEQRN